jgi:hypothetical protein
MSERVVERARYDGCFSAGVAANGHRCLRAAQLSSTSHDSMVLQ